MLTKNIRKIIAGAGIATAMTVGIASFTPASADPWGGGYGWRNHEHEEHEHFGPRFGFFPPPVYYGRPVRCFTRRIIVWGPYGYHSVYRRICRR